jgi:hypothetical protein
MVAASRSSESPGEGHSREADQPDVEGPEESTEKEEVLMHKERGQQARAGGIKDLKPKRRPEGQGDEDKPKKRVRSGSLETKPSQGRRGIANQTKKQLTNSKLPRRGKLLHVHSSVNGDCTLSKFCPRQVLLELSMSEIMQSSRGPLRTRVRRCPWVGSLGRPGDAYLPPSAWILYSSELNSHSYESIRRGTETRGL